MSLDSKSFNYLLCLASFRNWSHVTPSAVNLAKAGLRFTGNDDITKCNLCGIEISKWKLGDDPILEHRTRSPQCLFANNEVTDEDVKSIANSILPSLHYSGSNSKDLMDSKQTTSRVSGFSRADAPFVEVCKQIISRVIAGKYSPAKVVVDRAIPDYDILRSEQARHSTFGDWPESAARIVGAIALARNGFFYTGQADKVQCVYCHGFLHGWVEGDQPDSEHRAHFPNCSFVLGKQVGNIADFVDASFVPQLQVSVITAVYVMNHCCL